MNGGSARLLALVALALACLLAGCGENSGDPFDTSGKDGTVQVEERPTMETVLARYRAFQADLLAQLDKQFGERHWYALDELSLGVCGDADVKDGQIAYLPTMGLRGT